MLGSVYLAARFSRQQEMREKAEYLSKLGINVISRWIYCDKDDTNADDLAEESIKDVDDVHNCDTLILFSEGEKPHKGGGRHTEFGMALAWGKKIIVIGPREQVFHYLPQVENHISFGDFIFNYVRKAA